jgi:ATP-dependent DNA helicase PIF1
MERLNDEQRNAVHAAIEGKNIFITGPGGTGKSYLLSVLVKELKKVGRRVTVTAMTGCAALLLELQAKTLHAWAGIGLGRGSIDSLVAGIVQHYPRKKRWTNTDCLIVDEISMLTPGLLETLDKIGRFVRKKPQQPMGGLQVIFVGDFYQLPPVSRDGPADRTFAFQTPVWQQIIEETHQLRTIFRQQDPVFQQILGEARQGALSPESIALLESRKNMAWKGQLIRPTLVFTRNADVSEINSKQFNKLPSEIHTFVARTALPDSKSKGKDATAWNELFDKSRSEKIKKIEADYKEVIEKMDRDAPYTPNLQLKVGAQVMLITNLNFETGLVNGSRGIVKGFCETNGEPFVQFLNTVAPIRIEPHKWESDTEPAFCREQIPLRLAYSVTIHKAQGASLDSALVDIGPATFEYGQAYVALSRVRSLAGLWVYDLDPRAFRVHPAVREFYSALDTCDTVE